MWSVWEEWRVPDEEGFLLGLCGFDKIVDRLHAFPADFQTRIPVTACGARHSMGEADIFIGDVPDFPCLESQVTRFGDGFGESQ